MDDDAKELVEAIWPFHSRKSRLANGERVRDLTFEAYYGYYKRQFLWMVSHTGTPNTATYSKRNLINLVRRLQSDPEREAALLFIKSQSPIPSDEVCENILNLAARLLLMLRFGNMGRQTFPRECLNWTDGLLSDFIHGYFAAPPQLRYESVRLPKLFNAWSITAIAGIEIDFTDNIADHLRLVKDDTRLLIFHHASFLELQQK